jgi:hypothetical protein
MIIIAGYSLNRGCGPGCGGRRVSADGRTRAAGGRMVSTCMSALHCPIELFTCQGSTAGFPIGLETAGVSNLLTKEKDGPDALAFISSSGILWPLLWSSLASRFPTFWKGDDLFGFALDSFRQGASQLCLSGKKPRHNRANRNT